MNEFVSSNKRLRTIKADVNKISPESRHVLKRIMDVVKNSELTADEINHVLIIANNMTEESALGKKKAFCKKNTECT